MAKTALKRPPPPPDRGPDKGVRDPDRNQALLKQLKPAAQQTVLRAGEGTDPTLKYPEAYYSPSAGRPTFGPSTYGQSDEVRAHEYGHMFDFLKGITNYYGDAAKYGRPALGGQKPAFYAAARENPFVAYANQAKPMPYFSGMYGNPRTPMSGDWDNYSWGGHGELYAELSAHPEQIPASMKQFFPHLQPKVMGPPPPPSVKQRGEPRHDFDFKHRDQLGRPLIPPGWTWVQEGDEWIARPPGRNLHFPNTTTDEGA